MKDMESKQHTPSVMSRLMGIDASRPLMLPVHQPQRVLSENYMRRTSCVGFPWRKRSSYKSSLFRMNIEKQEFKDAFEEPNLGELHDFPVQMECDDAQDVLRLSNGSDDQSSVAYLKCNSLLHQPYQVSGLFSSDVSRHSSDACSISERIPKHDNNIGRQSRVELNNRACFSPDSIVLLKPRFGKARYTTPFFSPTCSYNITASSNRKQKGHPRNDNWESSEAEEKGTPKELGSERWKRTKRFQEVGWASGGKNIGNMLAVPDQETSGFDLGKHGLSVHFPRRSHLLTSTADGSSGSTIRNGTPHGEWRPEEVFNWWPKTSRKKASDEKERSFPRSSRFRRTLKSSLSQNNVEKKQITRISCLDKEHNYTTQEAQVMIGGPSDNLQEKHLSERMIASDMVSEVKIDLETCDIGSSSHITEQQHSASATCIFLEISTRSKEDGSAPRDCCKMDSEFLPSSEELSHPSPISPLQPPYDEDTSSSSESLDGISIDINGTQKHIQLPESEVMEEELDELGIIVSSDNDIVEEGGGPLEQSRIYFDASKIEESRDFSYLVDVLYESGFHGGSFNLRGKILSGLPVDSLVFEALEKKFGEHKSWVRSERRLLFDCINLGLVEIIQPVMDTRVWMKPVTRRMVSKWSWEGIEEELWMLLESQKREAKKDLSEKVMGEEMQWLDLKDIIYDICMEVERMLMDELAREVISMEGVSK